MKYVAVLNEIQAISELDGSRDARGGLVPFKFNPMVRLGLVKRLRRLRKAQEEYDETRIKLAEDCGVKDKAPAECDPAKFAAFQKQLNELLNADSKVPQKRWTEKELNVEENQLPVTVLEILLVDEEVATPQG